MTGVSDNTQFNYTSGRIYSARLTGLKSATRYYYSLGEWVGGGRHVPAGLGWRAMVGRARARGRTHAGGLQAGRKASAGAWLAAYEDPRGNMLLIKRVSSPVVFAISAAPAGKDSAVRSFKTTPRKGAFPVRIVSCSCGNCS